MNTIKPQHMYVIRYAMLIVYSILFVTFSASIAQCNVVAISNPNSVMRYCVVL